MIPLLQTKFYIPPSRPQQVLREHLVAQLGDNGARRLTLISAPAGFGKTTLVSAWISQSAWPVAWLSLDDDDNDPTRFLTYLIAALQTCKEDIKEDIGASALARLAAPQVPPLKTTLTLLLNDLDKLTAPLALILDDYHLITAPLLHEALAFLIDNLPPQIHLVITTRIDPPLPLARWRVRNQLAEVHADDLSFIPEEARTFLNEVMGLTLSAAEITALETRTEGWIAGLQLAALSMQGRADVASFIRAFSGSHRHVLSYLVEEVLNRRPEGTLDFLLQTSILDQMTAGLCDIVTGRHDSQELLQRLEQANLFLIPLDDEAKWYRYHHLFAEVCRARLQQTQPEAVPHLHQRASAWYETSGQIEQAVAHALAVPDVEHAATLVERVAMARLLHQGEVLLVRRLMERLPVAVVHVRPQLSLAYGIVLAVLTGQFDAVQQLLVHAAAAFNASSLPAPALPTVVAGGLALLHATVARFRDDPDRALELAQHALLQLSDDDQMLRAGAMLTIGAAYLQRGESLAGQQALVEAVALGVAAGAGNITLAAMEELATDQARQGQLAQAKRTCEQALTHVARWGAQMMPPAGMAQIAIGEVLYEWNDLEGAKRLLMEGIPSLLATNETTMLVRGYSVLARCQWANGEAKSALMTLQQGEEWLNQIQIYAPRARNWLAAQRACLQLWQGNIDAALRWDHGTHTVGESAISYLQHLTCVRVRLAEYAHVPLASFLSEASNILAPLLATAEAKGWGSHVIEILMLRALLEQAQGNLAAAHTTLIRAFTLAEPEGYLRLFVDEGAAIQNLISAFRVWIAKQTHIGNQAKLSHYADKLLKLFPTDQQLTAQKVVDVQPSSHNLVDALSIRELEVLHLVAAGLSNTQIAARLIVTTGTVKTHINHIFGKLAVQNRTQAVARAHELGLLNN